MKWKTKDGQVLDIKDMSDTHIENCIKMLQINLKKIPDWTIYVGDGELAEEAVDQENIYNDNLKENIHNGIRALQKELRRRK